MNRADGAGETLENDWYLTGLKIGKELEAKAGRDEMISVMERHGMGR